MTSVFARLGGMLAAPRVTLHALARGTDGDVTDVVIAFVLARVLLQGGHVAKNLWLLAEAPGASLRRITDALVRGVQADLLVLAAAVVVVIALFRLLVARPPAWRSTATAVAYAGVPLLALELVAGAVSYAGFDRWWMPHHAVDDLGSVLVGGQVSMARFAAKCAIAYAIPLALLVDLLRTLRRADDATPTPPSPRRARTGALVLGAASVLLVALVGAHVARYRDALRPLLPGDEAPAFTLPLLTPEGRIGPEKLALESLRGSVVVVDFWASWCAPCRRSMPYLDVLASEFAADGLRVIAVSREPEAPGEAAKTLAELGVRFPSVVDLRAGTGRSYGDRVGLQSLPTSFILDRRGVVRHLHVGYVEPEVLRGELVHLLEER